jgi:hypothetical protein
VLRFFSEFQVAECQNFDRHFTENRPISIFSNRQISELAKVRHVTSSNFMFSKRQIFDQFSSNFVRIVEITLPYWAALFSDNFALRGVFI